MDVEDQHYFHQTGGDVSRTNQSGHLHTHEYVQKDSEVYYRPQKRLKGSRNSTLEETPGRSTTQVDMGNKDINTSTVRPKLQTSNHDIQKAMWEANDKHHKEKSDERREDLDENQNVDGDRRHDPGGSHQQYPQDPQPKELPIIRNPHRNLQTKTNVQLTIHNNPELSLNDMPTEIMAKILSYLTFKDTCRIKRTNTRMRDLAMMPELWQSITIKL